MSHEEDNFGYHDRDEHEHQHDHKAKLRMPKMLKIVIGIVGSIGGFIVAGLALFAIGLIAGPASGIAQFVAGIWEGILGALQPVVDLYNNTVQMIPGFESE